MYVCMYIYIYTLLREEKHTLDLNGCEVRGERERERLWQRDWVSNQECLTTGASFHCNFGPRSRPYQSGLARHQYLYHPGPTACEERQQLSPWIRTGSNWQLPRHADPLCSASTRHTETGTELLGSLGFWAPKWRCFGENTSIIKQLGSIPSTKIWAIWASKMVELLLGDSSCFDIPKAGHVLWCPLGCSGFLWCSPRAMPARSLGKGGDSEPCRFRFGMSQKSAWVAVSSHILFASICYALILLMFLVRKSSQL